MSHSHRVSHAGDCAPNHGSDCPATESAAYLSHVCQPALDISSAQVSPQGSKATLHDAGGAGAAAVGAPTTGTSAAPWPETQPSSGGASCGAAAASDFAAPTVGLPEDGPPDQVQAVACSGRSPLMKTAHNPLPRELPPPTAALGGNHGVMHVVVLLGLPEAGKPFLAKRMRQYLRFFHGAAVQLFDICDYMFHGDEESNAFALSHAVARWVLAPVGAVAGLAGDGKAVPAEGIPGTGSRAGRDASPGVHVQPRDSHSADALPSDVRDRPSRRGSAAVEETVTWAVGSGRVAIVYASDTLRTFHEKWSASSKERRRYIADEVRRMSRSVKLILVEVKVTDPDVLRRNIALKRRAHGDNAAGDDEGVRRVEAAVREFAKRYVTIQKDGSEDDLSYVQFINYGSKVVANRMHGFLRMRIAQFLSTIHTETHTIYLTRSGESEYDRLCKLGGNSGCTEKGIEYARRLGDFAEKVICREDGSSLNKARLWTCSMRRSNETAGFIRHPVVEFDGEEWEQMSQRVYRNLDDLFVGEYEGLTFDEVKERRSADAARRGGDPGLARLRTLSHRYPRGESYLDIIARLEPLVHELESFREPTLVVSHHKVLRILLAYLMGYDREEAPALNFPQHTVVKLRYNAWVRCEAQHVLLGPHVDAPHSRDSGPEPTRPTSATSSG